VNRLAAAYGRLLDGFAVAAALILLAMVALVTADILLRNIIGAGFVWANEVSEYALYAMTLLTAPWLLRRGRHVRLDLVLVMVPPRLAWAMEAIGDLIGILTCLVLLRYGIAMTYESWRLGSITIKILYFPEWWTLAPLPAMFALLAVEFVFRFDRLIRGEHTRRAESTSVG
jgi:TRAP-type C4-dicarboxylate transport system permease small subunit